MKINEKVNELDQLVLKRFTFQTFVLRGCIIGVLSQKRFETFE